MSPHAAERNWAERLVGQLEILSELAEGLTCRLLELEERLASQESRLSALSADSLRNGIDEAMDQRMRETEDRLALMEELLRRKEPRTQPRTLHALSSTQPPAPPFLSEGSPEEPLFLEESHGDPADEVDAPFADDGFDHSFAS